jgi:predicted nucleic acid-binding protein
MPFGGGTFIADNSVWARTGLGRPFQAEWEAAVRGRQIATCGITRLEHLYSARTEEEHDLLSDAHDDLPSYPVGTPEYAAAAAALRALTPGLQHRPIKLADALIAACAANAGVGVLHYDKHFDRLAEVLPFESRWVALRGSMP